MIEFSELLSASSVDCKVKAQSKKKALQRLSEILSKQLNAQALGEELGEQTDGAPATENDSTKRADSNKDQSGNTVQGVDTHEEVYSEMDILDAFIGRERLGSTGLGKGISLPHGRLPDLETPIAGMITLSEGVEFESPDDENVDVLFGLLVPESCTEEHLQILAHMAKAFSDDELCKDVRAFEENEPLKLHQRLQQWSVTNAADEQANDETPDQS